MKNWGKKNLNKNKFSNNYNNKFVLLLQKGVCPEEILNEASLTEKEDSYSHLNMEDITDADYTHAKRVCKDSEIKNLGEDHDFFVQSDTLLLADVFENFRNMCLEIYDFDPAKFLSVLH